MSLTIIPRTNGLTRVQTGLTSASDILFQLYPRQSTVVELFLESGTGSATFVATTDEMAPATSAGLASDSTGPFSASVIKNLGEKLGFVGPLITSGTWTMRVTN